MSIVDTKVSRYINKKLILETILDHQEISRADIARILSLNKVML